MKASALAFKDDEEKAHYLKKWLNIVSVNLTQ